MKAMINGIQVEGTPQEIAEYQRIINNDSVKDSWLKWPWQPITTPVNPWSPFTYTTSAKAKACGSNQCFCTGECSL